MGHGKRVSASLASLILSRLEAIENLVKNSKTANSLGRFSAECCQPSPISIASAIGLIEECQAPAEAVDSPCFIPCDRSQGEVISSASAPNLSGDQSLAFEASSPRPPMLPTRRVATYDQKATATSCIQKAWRFVMQRCRQRKASAALGMQPATAAGLMEITIKTLAHDSSEVGAVLADTVADVSALAGGSAETQATVEEEQAVKIAKLETEDQDKQFDGVWMNLNDVPGWAWSIRWPQMLTGDGDMIPLRRASPNSFRCMLDGDEFIAESSGGNRLRWNDGDVWPRVAVDGDRAATATQRLWRRFVVLGSGRVYRKDMKACIKFHNQCSAIVKVSCRVIREIEAGALFRGGDPSSLMAQVKNMSSRVSALDPVVSLSHFSTAYTSPLDISLLMHAMQCSERARARHQEALAGHAAAIQACQDMAENFREWSKLRVLNFRCGLCCQQVDRAWHGLLERHPIWCDFCVAGRKASVPREMPRLAKKGKRCARTHIDDIVLHNAFVRLGKDDIVYVRDPIELEECRLMGVPSVPQVERCVQVL